MPRTRTHPLVHFDCMHGISGDMTLGALVDAGVPLAALRRELSKLPLEGYRLRSRRVQRGPLACTKVDVIQKGRGPGEGKGRHLRDIERLLRKSTLEEPVLAHVREAFHHLARAEAHVHGTTVDEIHFHEVGAIDAIVDITGAMIGFERLGVERGSAGTIPLGSGSVECRHGTIPLPGPATLEILRDCPVRIGADEGELTTPTGAAILVTLVREFGPAPAMTVGAIGLGAGDRESEGMPNVLRLVFGDPVASRRREGGIFQIETNLDDATPEVLAHVVERLLEGGALDAWIVPVQMKKGRPGGILGALVPADRLEAVEEIVFRETPTFGLRCFPVERSVLDREVREVSTPHGEIAVKVGSREGKVVSVSPEFESCRAAAERAGRPLREIYQAAMDAFRRPPRRSSKRASREV